MKTHFIQNLQQVDNNIPFETALALCMPLSMDELSGASPIWKQF
jgi:hypothetical protein